MKQISIKITIWFLLLALMSLCSLGLAQDNAWPEFMNRQVSLSVDNSLIKDVIRLLAKQNNFNISITGEELGKVSFILTEVPLSEALNAILTPNDLTWYIRNNIVVVKRAGDLTLDEIKTVVMNLKYISANEAKLSVSHLLSEGGKVEILIEKESSEDVDVIPSRIMLSDRIAVVDEMLNILEKVDIPTPQINISVKLVETSLKNDKKYGVDWPESYSASLGGLIDEETGLTSLGTYPIDGGDWVWGKINVNQVQAVLDWMVTNGNAKILSDPNITTISNKTSEIGVTQTIPIETINRFTEGAVIQDIVSFQDLEIGITLKVTARINEDDVITLKVNPIIEEIIGYTGPTDNQRPITSNRTMTTEVRVKSGETLVMGGLLKESKFETIKKVPIIGSIPLLGRLFQHRTVSTNKTDLTIFITPHIIDEYADTEE